MLLYGRAIPSRTYRWRSTRVLGSGQLSEKGDAAAVVPEAGDADDRSNGEP